MISQGTAATWSADRRNWTEKIRQATTVTITAGRREKINQVTTPGRSKTRGSGEKFTQEISNTAGNFYPGSGANLNEATTAGNRSKTRGNGEKFTQRTAESKTKGGTRTKGSRRKITQATGASLTGSAEKFIASARNFYAI